MSRFVFTLTQDGMEVARVESDDEARAVREIMHYAMMYAQDGPPCVVDRVRPKAHQAARRALTGGEGA